MSVCRAPNVGPDRHHGNHVHHTVTTALRSLPAPQHRRTNCDGCGALIVWAVTMAGPNGRGGKLMPLDPVESLAGNAAVRATGGHLIVRVLGKEESVDRYAEYQAMPHFATCPARTHPTLPPDVADLGAHRRRRRAGR